MAASLALARAQVATGLSALVRAQQLAGQVLARTQAAATALLDGALLAAAPQWALSRIRARAIALTLARHYEAAQGGRRTTGWPRSHADANVAAQPALALLRAHARDLVRNNAWARRGLQVVTNNTVGWGIHAKPVGQNLEKLRAAWNAWAGSTECDADGRFTFAGLQALIMRGVAESGEILVRRRRRFVSDGYSLPVQLQVLEADFLDTMRDNMVGPAGGPIIQGIEFDKLGNRVAYWLYDRHPGSNWIGSVTSKRIPATEVIHVYKSDRPGQVRGVSWFGAAVLTLKDFDEFEDAALMKQKIAACFAAFVTNVDGTDAPLGEKDATNELVETLEPGLVSKLQPGRNVTFANPPLAPDDGFSVRTLRRIAAALGVTYEDMTGDYSLVNFSSARMARLAHWANVHDWRWNMLVPQFCDPAWAWAMEGAALVGLIDADALPLAEWTPPPMPMIEPDKEGLALSRLVRTGAMTPSEMVRQQGEDPEAHWREYEEDLQRLDAGGIVLDCDVRRVSQAGLMQVRAGAASKGDGKDSAAPSEEAPGAAEEVEEDAEEGA